MALHIDTTVTLSWTGGVGDQTNQKTATLTPTRTPVAVFALATTSSVPGDFTGWDLLTVDYGGVSVPNKVEGAASPFVCDSWTTAGKAAVAARSSDTVTVTPNANTLPKHVMVGVLYSDIGGDSAYNTGNAGSAAAQTVHTVTVAHVGTLAAGWVGVGTFGQSNATANGSTGLSAGNSSVTSFSFGTSSVDYTTMDNTSAAASSVHGYSSAPNVAYVDAALVFSEVAPPPSFVPRRMPLGV
jgi:hypothetical protein